MTLLINDPDFIAGITAAAASANAAAIAAANSANSAQIAIAASNAAIIAANIADQLLSSITYMGATPSLPYLLDGLPPGALFSTPIGAQILDGSYCAVTDILTISSGSKYVTGPDGHLSLVAANEPAWDWSSGRRRLLIEATAATNRWVHSEDGASWGFGNCTTSVAPCAAFGSINGVTVTATGTNQYISVASVDNLSVTDGQTATVSVLMLATTTQDHAALGLYGSASGWGGNADSVAEVLSGPATISQQIGGLWGVTGLSTTVPSLVKVTRTYRAAESAHPILYHSAGGSVVGGAVIFGRPQFETGSTATSYIPTPGAASVTRIADDVRLSASALASMQSAGGCTIVMRGSAASGGVILSDSSTDQTVISDPTATHMASRGVVVPSGSGDPRNAFGMAVALSSSGGKAALNGGAVTALPSMPIVGPMRIGSGVSGGWACGPIFLDELVIWPFVGSDAGLQAQSRAWP